MHRITASIFPQICVDFDASKSSGSLKNKVDNYGHDAVAFLCSLQSISITWKSQRPGHFMLMFFPTDESSRNQNHPSPIFPSKISWIHDVRQMFPMCSQKIQHVFPRTPSRNLWLRVPRINSLASASFLADLQALGSGRGRWANRQPPLAQRRLLLGWILNLQTVLLRVNQHSGLKRTALTGCCRPKMCPSSDENKGLCPSVTLIGAQKESNFLQSLTGDGQTPTVLSHPAWPPIRHCTLASFRCYPSGGYLVVGCAACACVYI